jgi:hypothetical protein
MAHSLQLVIKKAYTHYDTVLSKARRLVSRVRKSGIAMEKLHSLCGKTLISDNSTRWNSTFYMVKRLLEVKSDLIEVLTDVKIDTLLVAEWTRLEELTSLLEPFASETDTLQTDALSLSYAIPALLDLECHLQTFSHCQTLSKAMLLDLRDRFKCILNPAADHFNALPAASTLLDPGVAAVLLAPEVNNLCTAAKEFIVHEVRR